MARKSGNANCQKYPIVRASNVPVKELQRLCNPFKDNCWMGLSRPITRSEVRRAIQERKLLKPDSRDREFGAEYKRHEHVQKIAYFAVNGWKKAIVIDVGVPSLGCHVDWLVDDGNHRLAAAIFRQDEFIRASISGATQFAKELGLL